jgi:energy-coupling factor transporter ATP-binding protein EcfA2
LVDLRVTRLTTRSGTITELPRAGVLCVVGGNNVGKSQLLREVPAILSGQLAGVVVLDDIQYDLDLGDDVEAWIREHGIVEGTVGQPQMVTPLGGGPQSRLDHLVQLIGDRQVNYAIPWLLRTLDAGQRVAVATTNIGNPGMGPPSGPMHALYLDGELEQQLSQTTQKTFGFPLTLDRINADVRLRVGEPGLPPPSIQHPTKEYADAVAQLPSLADQGDGVKNYLGMVLHLMTALESITIIDEPEAFLHPAQARSLGRHLGRQALAKDRQLLTATHDRDFVLGLLETDCPLTFLRLNRTQTSSSAATLSAGDVKRIWDRPALRYSNILQGLFHRAVAVCEADADCRWYAAVLDEMGRKRELPSEEALFVPAGGKDQVPTCLSALRALEVRAFAILDFDALLDLEFLRKLLVETLGVDATEMLKQASAIDKQLTTPDQRARAKQSGLSGLPPGDVTRMAQELVEALCGHDILVVPSGELESFDRAIGGKGSAWVTAALIADKHLASPEAEQLLKPIMSAVGPSTGEAPSESQE